MSPGSAEEASRRGARSLIAQLGETAPILTYVESSTECAQSPTQSDVALDILTIRLLWSPAEQLTVYEGKSITVHSLSVAHEQMDFGEPYYAAIDTTRLDPDLELPCDIDGEFVLTQGMEKQAFERSAQMNEAELQDAIEASYVAHGSPGPMISNAVSYAFLGDGCCQ